MFNYSNAMDVLRDYEKGNWKAIKKMFTDDTFMEWLYNAGKDQKNVSKINALYTAFTKQKVMKDMVKMFYEVGYDIFNRNVATFIWGISNLAIDGNNKLLIDVAAKVSADQISTKEAERIKDKVVESNEVVNKLIKASRKIVKSEAKELSKVTGINKNICIWAYQNVPEPKYIDKYKIGSLNGTILSHIYSSIEEGMDFNLDIDNNDWRKFYKAIFGKDNLIEVATFILLEGVHRISKYKNPNVKVCWDSLTKFALAELEKSPDALKTQMIELYIKRIEKMFSNGVFDLRVNLLTLDPKVFPTLCNVVSKYADAIKNIINNTKKE